LRNDAFFVILPLFFIERCVARYVVYFLNTANFSKQHCQLKKKPYICAFVRAERCDEKPELLTKNR